jgi:hypothetical protein
VQYLRIKHLFLREDGHLHIYICGCEQVDLTLEAAHLQRFIYNFRKSKDVSFPSPIYPLVHPTVLVEVSPIFYRVLDMTITRALLIFNCRVLCSVFVWHLCYHWFCNRSQMYWEDCGVGHVQTYEEGLSVAMYVNSRPLTKIHSRLAYIGSRCLLKMMLVRYDVPISNLNI